MAERLSNEEPLLELEEDDGLEKLDSQVQRAHEQLIQLKRQQEQIEKQKRELEELSKRQEQLTQGRAEMVEKFTRALVVLERETFDAQRRVEQLKTIHESYRQHLMILESINPKTWENPEINRELTKSLGAVDDARAEYSKSRAAINPETSEDILATTDNGSDAATGSQDFLYWLKSGLAFTLPLVLLGIVLLIVLYSLFAK